MGLMAQHATQKGRHMGLTKATNRPSAVGPKDTPWYMPSGNYTAEGWKVEITQSGAGYLYKISFRPEYDLAPTPLHVPIVSVWMDSQQPDDIADLYAILGTPYQEGNKVKWDQTGLIQWNGDTGDGARFGGKVELAINSKPPKHRPARDQFAESWFPATYEVKSVNPPGESDRIAKEAQFALIEQRQPALPGIVPPPPPPTKNNKKQGLL